MYHKIGNVSSSKKLQFVTTMLIDNFDADITESFIISLKHPYANSRKLTITQAFYYLQNGAKLNPTFLDYIINLKSDTSMHELINSHTILEKHYKTDD